MFTLYGKMWSLYKVSSRGYLISATYVYITELVFPWYCATGISNNNVSKLAINNVTYRHLFFSSSSSSMALHGIVNPPLPGISVL